MNHFRNIKNDKFSAALANRQVEEKPSQEGYASVSKGVKKLKLEDKLFLVKTRKDKVSHIKIDQAKCRHCRFKVCLTVCPAGTYEQSNGEIKANYENCLECGSCQVVCTKGAIIWQNPRGGFGVTYING